MNSDRTRILRSFFHRFYAPEVEYVRFGRDHDGGYVVVNDITKNDFGVSFGVSDDVSWENDFSKHGAGIHMYDNSIDELPAPVKNSSFFKETIGDTVSLDDVISRIDHTGDLIMKMDIEGSEFELIRNATKDSILRFRQIVVEFHWLFRYFNNNDSSYREAMDTAMSKLLETHVPVWVHPNNYSPVMFIEDTPVPDVIEVLFLRKTSYNVFEDQLAKLDMPNNSSHLNMQISFY